MVLDVMMPGEDGLQLTASLRETMTTPILVLTARGDADDRILGLEAGADDYLAKPFEPRELLLRINAILRRIRSRSRGQSPKTLHLGGVRYDMNSELWRGRDLIRLTATEAMLMRIFAARAHEPVTRQQLVEDLSSSSGGRRGAGARRRRPDHPPAPPSRTTRARRATCRASAAPATCWRRTDSAAPPAIRGPRRLACPAAVPSRITARGRRRGRRGKQLGGWTTTWRDSSSGRNPPSTPPWAGRSGQAALDRRVRRWASCCTSLPDGGRAAYPRDRHPRRLLDDLAGAAAARRSRGGARGARRGRACQHRPCRLAERVEVETLPDLRGR